MKNKEIPVELNKTYAVEIIRQENMGLGIAVVDGFTVFVNNGLPGDIGEIVIDEIKKNFAIGTMVSFTKESDNRVKPICPKFNTCGGCDLMHQDYNTQLTFKKNKVIDIMKRIAKLENLNIKDVIGMENPYNYRNKAVFHIENNIGFYKRDTNEIVDIDECYLLDPLINSAYLLLKDYIKKNKVEVNTIMLRVGNLPRELMIVFYGKYNKAVYDNFIDFIKDNIENTKTVVLKDINKDHILYGDGYIMEKVMGLSFKISPESFFQVNTIQVEKPYSIVKDYIDKNDKVIFDLYSGTGTIALMLSNKDNKIIGIEVIESAVNDAINNAQINNIDNVEFILGEVSYKTLDLYNKKIIPDVVVVDPPRKGLDEYLLKELIKMNPKKILYISCDPVTLARDLQFLTSQNYTVEEITPIDMFPNTYHIECVVKILRKD